MPTCRTWTCAASRSARSGTWRASPARRSTRARCSTSPPPLPLTSGSASRTEDRPQPRTARNSRTRVGELPDPRLMTVTVRSAAPAQQLLARTDLPGVEAGQVQTAVEAGVLDLHAAVHDHVEPGLLRDRGGLLVPGAQLQPQRL